MQTIVGRNVPPLQAAVISVGHIAGGSARRAGRRLGGKGVGRGGGGGRRCTPVTGGEDFAFMLEAKSGAFIFIGNGTGPDGVAHGLHTPKYDFNDEIIPLGAAWWVRVVEQELSLGG